MKTVIKTIAKLLKRQRGFTLVEMVTVIAIMGVMAAVAVPMVTTQLGKARDKSYDQDKALIQTAVDSFFTDSNNVRYQGQRQYPILGANSGTTELNIVTGVSRIGEVVNSCDATQETVPVDVNIIIDGVIVPTDFGELTPLNPLRGTLGGEPKWMDGPVDNPDLNRNQEDKLSAEKDSIARTGVGWYVTKVTHQGDDFAVDSRDYFIDFTLLVDAGLLQNVPESASPDNGGGTVTGSYSWYVKATGAVESAFFHFPTNGTDIFGNEPEAADPDNDADPTDPNDHVHATSEDLRGFFEGVYP